MPYLKYITGIGSSSSTPRRDEERGFEQARSHERNSEPGEGLPSPKPIGAAAPAAAPSASSFQDGTELELKYAAIARAAPPKPPATSATARLAPKPAVGTSFGLGGKSSKGAKVKMQKTPTAEQIAYMEKATKAKAARAAEVKAARLAAIPEERPAKADVPLRRTPTPAGEKADSGHRVPIQARDKMSLSRMVASFSPRGSREFPEDARQRTLMESRPTPLLSHKIPGLVPYERASLWSAENRDRARFEVERHGGRPVPGGWPKLTGTLEKKMAQAVREIDAILRHPQVQVVIERDTHGLVCAKYRIPDKHEEGMIGIVNTGRGVIYSTKRLEHLMNPDGEHREFKDPALEKIAQIRARKAVRNGS